jgi:AmmeMemoRadiSam system protein A
MAVQAAFAVPHPPLIIPGCADDERAQIPSTVNAYREVARRIEQIDPELIVVTSPHADAYRDWFCVSPGEHAHGDFRQFRVRNSDLEVDYDEQFTSHLDEICQQEGIAAGTQGERHADLDHATYIPLWFIEQAYAEAGRQTDYRVVRIGLSGLPAREHYRLGQAIAQCADDLGRRWVYVASGDLSHKLTADGPYGFAPEGPEFDKQITKAFAEGDFRTIMTFDEAFCDKAAECGLRSFQIMTGALDGLAVKPELLSYEGPFGVGYGVAAFTVTGPDDSRHLLDELERDHRDKMAEMRRNEDPYVRLARHSVETFVRTNCPGSLPDGLPEEMLTQRAGVFVSLHEDGQLRGCIGTIRPAYDNIAEEIVHNGMEAATNDPRFSPVRPDELDRLEISVDVLGPTEPIDSPDQLDPKTYGVVVTRGMRRGLLLPDLEGVDTVEDQIAIAKRKAGIAQDEKVKLERFKVTRHY